MSIASDPWPRRHLLNVEQYYRMAEAGVLAPDARVELIEGEIVDMAPIGSSHAGVVNWLMQTFAPAAIAQRCVVAVQQPLRLGNRSEPQPDMMLLKPRADLYRTSHPTASDVLLLIEVSDSTLKFDRGTKAALYARHGVKEVWIVDLPNRQLHCLESPIEGQYGSNASLTPPGRIEIPAVPGLHLDLALLFGELVL